MTIPVIITVFFILNYNVYNIFSSDKITKNNSFSIDYTLLLTKINRIINLPIAIIKAIAFSAAGINIHH